jgi:hypothetical protein
MFYQSGIFGVFFFSLFVFYFLYACIRQIKKNEHILKAIIAIAIGLSIIGNTFILGITEHTGIKNLFLYCALFIITNSVTYKKIGSIYEKN